MTFVEARNLPRHVAIIMDGNGRWAQLRGQAREAGHKAGSDAVRRVVRAARRLGVSALTLYAFSEQNWARPEGEVEALMGLLEEFLRSEREEILDNGIRLVGIGDLSRLPEYVRVALDPLSSDSCKNDRMTLALALSYGAREEIADVARALATEAAAGRLDPSTIDATTIASRIPSLGVGDPDMILRTGGEQRLSNFLLYGAANAELVFSDRLWPDFTEKDLFDAIAIYQERVAAARDRGPQSTNAPASTTGRASSSAQALSPAQAPSSSGALPVARAPSARPEPIEAASRSSAPSVAPPERRWAQR
jgi:undecaprenyl diphosphate synthase